MNTKEKGNWGEDRVCEYLTMHGYRIVRRNFHTRFGEIDIIAKDEDTVVFVEVKSRKSKRFATAAEYVDYNKQKKIIMSARCYLANSPDVNARFDVAEVYYKSCGEVLELIEINYIKDAFVVNE